MKTILSFAFLLIAGHPAAAGDLEDTFQALKDAESKKDATLVKTLAGKTCDQARKAAAEPAPEDPAQKESWTKRIAYARDIEVHTEYALFATAIQGPPATTLDLLSALEKQNPKSRYLENAYGTYFVALTKTGAASRIPAVAEAANAHFPDNEDLLLVLADNATNRKQTDRALGYSERLISVLQRHSAPAGMSAGDWERKKTAALGHAYWTAGVMHSEKAQHYEADKDLRAALPLIKGDESMLGTALFYLGVANYQLGSAARSRARVLEAAKFSEQSAALKGPLAVQAWRNAQAMKTEAVKLR